MSIGYKYYSSFPEDMKMNAFLELQEFMRGEMQADRPFWIARMSGIETGEIGRYHTHRDFKKVDRKEIQRHSGIFIRDEESWMKYIHLTDEALSSCDRLAIWDGSCYLQCRDMYEYCTEAFTDKHTIPAHSLEPYYFMASPAYDFPSVFGDKKILIVTSHTKSVEYQLTHNFDGLFRPYKIFPNPGNILVYKTVQQNGESGDGNDWTIHFEKMCRDISTLQFDVAFIGCGGFSNLLGSFIHKNLQKSALYIGGPLQLYFGIIGRRWLDNPRIRENAQVNGDSWICPLQEDYVLGCTKVDQACYWM